MHCPKPVICRVNGDVVGGANAFHLAADFVVMNRTSKFQQVGVGVGSVAAFGPTQWWPLLVNDRRARDILMQLKPVPADLADQWGLVTAVADYDQLDAEVEKIVANLARMFPEALRYTKVALNHHKEMMFREMTQAREWCSLHFPSIESRSGFGAFFQKRPIDSTASWKAINTGQNSLAPYGGYSVHCRGLRR
jgi:enoyl-CoA hydratase/carnithine racemase